MVKLVFLGRLEDVAGVAELHCQLAEPAAFEKLLRTLPTTLVEALLGPKVRVAVNGIVTDPAALVAFDGDEIAFFPPVSGG